MDAATALADLTEISAQVESAVVFADDGSVLASTVADEQAGRLARTGLDLLAAGADVHQAGDRRLTQVEVALREASVFVVRDGARGIAATVASGSPAGLVLYDLRSCLRSIDEPKQPARRKRTAKKNTAKKNTADA